MKQPTPTVTVPVDLTNPGQFFACCGLLELADRLWPGAEGWYDDRTFYLSCDGSLRDLLTSVAALHIDNTMSSSERDRLQEIARIARSRKLSAAEEAEEAHLDGMRRKAPIVLSGAISLRIDWFCDPYTRGFSLKTWAGQQAVLTIARDMHGGLVRLVTSETFDPWASIRDIGLPFMFDGDIGAQGNGRDIGFVFDALKGKRHLEIRRGCRPALEFLSFVGLQRFRPLELPPDDRFRYAAWRAASCPVIAAAYASTRAPADALTYEFRMFNRNKDYYCFFPSIPFQGDRDE